jgi:lysophospholipase L1-like esterase
MTAARRVFALATALFGLSLVLVLAGSEAEDLSTMAALGDSLTVALRSCPAADCRANSWSTGTTPAVDSHLLRLREGRPGLAASNYAVSGRKVADLDRQVAQAVAGKPQYVTILIGTNDVCRESVAAMTPVATFRAQFAQAMTRLSSALPAARVFVASIPDPENLREAFAANAKAKAVWAADGPQGTCGVFLQTPDSVAAAVTQRRAAGHQRLLDLDRQLAEVCALNPHCVYDGGAVTAWQFGAGDVSTIDYFHLSASGQAALAALTYPLAFPPPAPPAAPPPEPDEPPVVTPPPAPAATRRLPAKLKVQRATIRGGRFDVLLGITGRATGRLRVSFDAGGRRTTFTVAVGADRDTEKLVRIRRRLPAAQRDRRTGSLGATYAGDARVLPDGLRMRVADAPSRLRISTLRLVGARLRVSGTLDRHVSGIVHLRLSYARDGAVVPSRRYSARVRRGRWSADELLPAAAIADPEAYLRIQFSGDGAARGGPYGGEQDGRMLANVRRR